MIEEFLGPNLTVAFYIMTIFASVAGLFVVICYAARWLSDD